MSPSSSGRYIFEKLGSALPATPAPTPAPPTPAPPTPAPPTPAPPTLVTYQKLENKYCENYSVGDRCGTGETAITACQVAGNKFCAVIPSSLQVYCLSSCSPMSPSSSGRYIFEKLGSALPATPAPTPAPPTPAPPTPAPPTPAPPTLVTYQKLENKYCENYSV